MEAATAGVVKASVVVQGELDVAFDPDRAHIAACVSDD